MYLEGGRGIVVCIVCSLLANLEAFFFWSYVVCITLHFSLGAYAFVKSVAALRSLLYVHLFGADKHLFRACSNCGNTRVKQCGCACHVVPKTEKTSSLIVSVV